jgi:uncharacterized protein YndB with AHSA1/START domain
MPGQTHCHIQGPDETRPGDRFAVSKCASMHDPDFIWPPGFEPREARLYIRNERLIDAPIENVWRWLIAAPLWPQWFRNATNVKLDSGTALSDGLHFRWSQSGVALDTIVREFVPPHRLAWFAKSPLIRAYHTWDLREVGGQTSVVTDETQHGIMPSILGFALRRQMLAVHDRWLAELANKAGQGAPE